MIGMPFAKYKSPSEIISLKKSTLTNLLGVKWLMDVITYVRRGLQLQEYFVGCRAFNRLSDKFSIDSAWPIHLNQTSCGKFVCEALRYLLSHGRDFLLVGSLLFLAQPIDILILRLVHSIGFQVDGNELVWKSDYFAFVGKFQGCNLCIPVGKHACWYSRCQ